MKDRVIQAYNKLAVSYEHEVDLSNAIPTAIDISLEMIEATKRRTKGKATVIHGDLSENLPFEK